VHTCGLLARQSARHVYSQLSRKHIFKPSLQLQELRSVLRFHSFEKQAYILGSILFGESLVFSAFADFDHVVLVALCMVLKVKSTHRVVKVFIAELLS